MQEQLIHIDKVLFLRVAEGDESAFNQLFRTYSSQLGGFIYSITGSMPLTQDIVQDVFMKIWNNRATLATVDSFKAYLFVMARNQAFNSLKQIAREENRKREWANTVLYNASHESAETKFSDAEELVEQAVERLPNQQKTVYTLSRRNGMKHREIATELNISIETVKKHMVLALRFIKNHLRAHIDLLIILFTACAAA